MTQTAKGGNLKLTDVRAPDHVQPGEAFDVEADVENWALFVNPWEADNCEATEGEDAGYEIVVEFDGPGSQTQDVGPMCHPITEIGAKNETYTATFTAPDSSDSVTVSANVHLPGSGDNTGEETATVTVESGESATPEDPDDDGGGWPGLTGGDDTDGGGQGPLAYFLPEWAGPVAGLILLLALLWVSRPYVDLASNLGGSA
ncbi:hypothetical protein [Halomicrobium urmianum]|uniref:hypothetical protein n=1 Tax=Halomicrobium urmianum TaxID=1586233 RepID=UPI001CD920F1|nr:hypothetical protein [Halomicrobium urmianum]